MPGEVPGPSDDSDLIIRLDKLGPPDPASGTKEDGEAALRRWWVKTGFSPDTVSANARFRIFNAEYMVSAMLAIAFVVLAFLFFATAFGNKPDVAFGVVGGPICLCLGSFFVHSILWGLCVNLDDHTLTLRYHVLTQSFPLDEIASFGVVPNLRMLEPVLTLMVTAESGKTVRTPLVSTRSLAGEARLNEIGHYMSQRLASPPSPIDR